MIYAILRFFMMVSENVPVQKCAALARPRNGPVQTHLVIWGKPGTSFDVSGFARMTYLDASRQSRYVIWRTWSCQNDVPGCLKPIQIRHLTLAQNNQMGLAKSISVPGQNPICVQLMAGPMGPGLGPGPDIIGQEHFSETVSWKTLILHISLNHNFLIHLQKNTQAAKW